MDDSSVQLIKGSGTVLLYDNKDPNTGYYLPETRDRNSLVRGPDGTWVETQPDGFQLQYVLAVAPGSSSSFSASSLRSSASAAGSKSSSPTASSGRSSGLSSGGPSGSGTPSASSSRGPSSSSSSRSPSSSSPSSSRSSSGSPSRSSSSSLSSGSQSSRSTSGSSSSSTVTACGCTLPTTLHITFSNCTGVCACLEGVTLPMTYNPASASWKAQPDPVNWCVAGQDATLVFACDTQSNTFVLAQDGYCVATIQANAGWTCSPVNFVFSINTNCCSGTLTATVTT